uniref:BTB domain-containing protein n=1 Tax=Oryza nivara TaxID=4536 RepID=A0A0E0GQT1_ORYNI
MPASWWSAAGRGKPSRSTTVVANTESGSHCLKVDGFSRSKNLRPGECLQSSTFPAGGHRWRMYCQPNSDGTEGTEGFVSVYLVLDEDVTKPVRAEYKFTVAVKNRLPFFLSKKPPEVTSATPPPPISVPPSDLCHHLAVLLDTALGSDVVFNVGGETMPAHQDVLAARSPVFCTEFFGVTMERTANRIIQIDDIEANVFSTLLYFIYTDSLPEMKKGEEKNHVTTPTGCCRKI